MWLYIFEDGETKYSINEPCEDDRASVDAGFLTLIDISGNVPTEYFDGEWHELSEAE